MIFAAHSHHDRARAYDGSRPMREQDLWPEHAAFMNALTDDGFVLLGGLLGDGDEALLIVRADDEQQVRARLAADPWVASGHLSLDRVEPWEILLGEPPAALD